MSGCNLSIFDFIDLLILKLAKLKRIKLNETNQSESFYDDFFTDFDERVLASESDPRKKSLLDAIDKGVTEFAAPGALLDVGCGCGDTLFRLSKIPGHRLHGVEFSAITANRARRLLGPQAVITNGSALNLPYLSESFETVTCTEVLEHLESDSQALTEIYRVLKSEGIFILTVPYRHWFKTYRTLMGHERHYDRISLTKLLQSHGFRVIYHMPNYPRWHRLSNYAFVISRVVGNLMAHITTDSDPHLVKLPFMQQPLLYFLNERINWIRKLDSQADYASLPTSTSLVVQKSLPIHSTRDAE